MNIYPPILKLKSVITVIEKRISFTISELQKWTQKSLGANPDFPPGKVEVSSE